VAEAGGIEVGAEIGEDVGSRRPAGQSLGLFGGESFLGADMETELSNAPALRCSALVSSAWPQGCCYPFV
jgi:hypothetical protein